MLAVHIGHAVQHARATAAEYARSLDQEELKSWYNRTTGRNEPPSKANRVVHADAAAVEAVLLRYAPQGSGGGSSTGVLAADGKRIRVVGTMHFETATLVEHTTGVPLASLNFARAARLQRSTRCWKKSPSPSR